jgi:endoglucanase
VHPDALPLGSIAVNQVGYLARGPKQATLVSDAAQPVAFRVENAAGEVVFSGESLPAAGRAHGAVDATSGLPVHVLEFSELATPGEGYVLVSGDARSSGVSIGAGPFAALTRDAMSFFYAQRCGLELTDAVLPGYARPAGHVGLAPNRGDAAVRRWRGPDADRLYPGWVFERTVDVSGGWYDAGDHGKYVVNAAFAVAVLLDAYERTLDHEAQRHSGADGAHGLFVDGALAVPEHGNDVPDLLDEVRWELEWMLRMVVPAGEQYAGLAFHKVHDQAYTAVPTWPHEDPEPRVLHRPSTTAALSLAATAAQASVAFAPFDKAFCERLLRAARTAFDAAALHPDLLAPAEAARFGGGSYEDDDITDDVYWAAAELYRATGEGRYLDILLESPWHLDGASKGDVFDLDGFEWNRVAGWARLRLARCFGDAGAGDVPDLPEHLRVRQSVITAADAIVELSARQPWGQPYAPETGGFVWGSNACLAANLAVLGTAHDLAGERRHREAFLAGLDYLFGRNALGMSYVTGYGARAVQRPHHRHWAWTLDPTMPKPPPGTLSGGPNSRYYGTGAEDDRFDGRPPQLCFEDVPESYTTNEVAINWNALLVWVASFAAGLASR